MQKWTGRAGDQSTGLDEVGTAGYFFFLPGLFAFPPVRMAAWAAARRAIGTRNGEQLT